jgi:hypothetical protein
MYQVTISSPSTLQSVDVLGNPLYAMVYPGAANAAHSSFSVTVPTNPTVLSYVTARITLADMYGNPISASEAGQDTNKLVVVHGECRSLQLLVDMILQQAADLLMWLQA